MKIEEFFENCKVPNSEYFLTGSRALGLETANSDYDYVVDIHYKHIILNYLTELKIEITQSNYNSGFYFFIDDKMINIISCIRIEFLAWKDALSILKMCLKEDVRYKKALSNKDIRYSFYEQLRGICKTYMMLGRM